MSVCSIHNDVMQDIAQISQKLDTILLKLTNLEERVKKLEEKKYDLHALYFK